MTANTHQICSYQIIDYRCVWKQQCYDLERLNDLQKQKELEKLLVEVAQKSIIIHQLNDKFTEKKQHQNQIKDLKQDICDLGNATSDEQGFTLKMTDSAEYDKKLQSLAMKKKTLEKLVKIPSKKNENIQLIITLAGKWLLVFDDYNYTPEKIIERACLDKTYLQILELVQIYALCKLIFQKCLDKFGFDQVTSFPHLTIRHKYKEQYYYNSPSQSEYNYTDIEVHVPSLFNKMLNKLEITVDLNEVEDLKTLLASPKINPE